MQALVSAPSGPCNGVHGMVFANPELQRIKHSNPIILRQHRVSRGCDFELYF